MPAGKILIVDDDQDLRYGLNIRLRANNYETCFAADAVTALTIAMKERPQLLLLDIGLPGGDGFLVMERMQRIADLACVPIIVLTARDALMNKERALKAGAVDFFQKPADNEKLMEAIAKILGGPVLQH